MKNNKFTLVISTLLCLMPIVLGIMLYDQLPDEMPVHFGVNNVPDSYASKNFAIFAIPSILAVVNIIANFVNANEPRKMHIARGMQNLLIWFIPVLSLFANSSIILYSIGVKFNIGIVISVVVGILFIIIGNYLPKTKQNGSVGIKIPWTLNSEKNWNMVHHLAGYMWMIGGLIMIVCGFLGKIGYIFLFATTIIMVAIPMIYSFYLYKKGI